MSDDQEERTEAASPKRRQEFRERGEVAKSQELTSAMMMIGGVGAGALILSGARNRIPALVEGSLGGLHDAPTWFTHVDNAVLSMLSTWLWTLAPGLGLLALVGIAANVMQFGLLWSPKALKFNPGKMNPASGLKRMFLSKDAFANLIRTLAKVTLIAIVAAATLYTMVDTLPELIGRSPVGIGSYLVKVAGYPLLISGLVMLLIGVAHFAYAKHQLEEKMKMTRQEARREAKDAEGDPMQKGRRKALHRERMNANKLIEAVPTATVVINNPTHYSVAIRYTEDEGIPVVVAKGVDHRAFQIRELARESDVPMIDSPPLARALHKHVAVGEPIPERFFTAVAEILAWVLSRHARRN